MKAAPIRPAPGPIYQCAKSGHVFRDIYRIDPRTIGDDAPLQRKLPIRPYRPSVFARFRIALERCRD
ncbi:MAG: hypothetical protein PHV13_03770 [Candidatus ainarchaeum sp.]|nr:hypothetical protein [Candidatus ainarchaeum sp.]